MFGINGGGAAAEQQPPQMNIPDYVTEEFRVCALEEAPVAQAGLPPLAAAWQEEQERAEEGGGGSSTPDLRTKFSYAWTLTKCANNSERQMGCFLLKQLLEVDAYEHPDECAYGLARTNYLHGDLDAARRWCEVLLRLAPDHTKGARLHGLVRTATADKDRRQLETAGIVGAAVMGAVGIGIALAAGAGKGKG